MSRFMFSLASDDDDPQLRKRMAENRMEGNIAISFRREPSYFAGCKVQGDQTEVIKCVDLSSDQIVGLGSRNTSFAFVDGKAERTGYLSDLRGDPRYRKGTLLARGYRYLRELHEQDPVRLYSTVIYEGNKPAIDSLLGGRAGLPSYVDFGRILSPALHLDFPKHRIKLPGVEFVRGGPEFLSRIITFLNHWQSQKQFAPVHDEAGFMSGRFSSIRPEDFFLAVCQDRIIGALAAWDQAKFRQTHVEQYSEQLSWIRPIYNLGARISSLKPLPQVGARIPYVNFACMAVEENNVQVFRALVRHAYNELRKGHWHFAIAGLHETDPLAQVLAEYRQIRTAGRLFVVTYADPSEMAQLEKRIPYVETGCL